jgi:hypothetical protein
VGQRGRLVVRGCIEVKRFGHCTYRSQTYQLYEFLFPESNHILFEFCNKLLTFGLRGTDITFPACCATPPRVSQTNTEDHPYLNTSSRDQIHRQAHSIKYLPCIDQIPIHFLPNQLTMSSLTPAQTSLKENYISTLGPSSWTEGCESLLKLSPEMLAASLHMSCVPKKKSHLSPKIQSLVALSVDPQAYERSTCQRSIEGGDHGDVGVNEHIGNSCL